MARRKLLWILLIFTLSACQDSSDIQTDHVLSDMPSIEGKQAYLNSPFVTAGDRVYMVGHQNGSFPELGWHIQGEMGGIWDHPIKLMDGFEVLVSIGADTIALDQANKFVNYPMANAHHFELTAHSLSIQRIQFVPDGMEGVAIQFLIHNHGDLDQDLGLSITGFSDLRPTWLGEETNMVDGNDQMKWNEEAQCWVATDSLNPWFTVLGTDLQKSKFRETQSPYRGLGRAGIISSTISLAAGETRSVNLVISGSFNSEAEALDTYKRIQQQRMDLLIAKQDRYQSLASQSRLTIPDKDLEQTFEWLKYNCDWLVRTVPGIGSGMTAGIPDYPWWFGVDSEYALQGYMAIGQREVVYNTIRLLDSVSQIINGNGRIIHEMSSNGHVFNPGNINETPQFSTLIRRIYDWSGDRNFLERYFPTIEQGLVWLMEENDEDGNLFPDGFGMMEIHGLNSEMIDVAAYTQLAFADAAYLAEELGKTELQQHYQQIADELALRINDRFWSEEFQSYADFIGTDQQALHLIDDAIIRADTLGKPWAVAELQQTRAAILANPSSQPRPFVLHHNWVVNTPMETGVADPEKAEMALRTTEQFVNPFGVFVTGIDRDESAGSDDGSFQGSKIFSYTGAVMTLPTGVQAIAENNYGNPDQALNYLQRMTRTFSYALPGSMYEVSPDYGMICQAWNIYSFAVPIVGQFFGIRPQAGRKMIRIQPQMPSDWEEAMLEQVAIGENVISMEYRREQGTTTILIEQKLDWDIQLVLQNVDASSVQREESMDLRETNGNTVISSRTSRISITYSPTQ